MTANELKAARKRLGFSQAALARAIGCSTRTVAGWEMGERGISPMAGTIIKLLIEKQEHREQLTE